MAHEAGLVSLFPLAGETWELTGFQLPRHQQGTVTIADPDTSATVTFDHAQENATYVALCGVVGITGSPASGSTRPYITSRATTGFTINVEATPAGVATVTVGWALFP